MKWKLLTKILIILLIFFCQKTIIKIKDITKLSKYLDDNSINYEKTGKEEITIYNKINIPKFITELNNNKIEIEDIKEEKDTLENYFLKY